MAYEISAQPQQYNGDDEGFVANLLQGVKSIPHLPNALLRGLDEQGVSPEELGLRRRALSEAALWVLPALVTPAAGVLLKAAPALVRGVISGAAGLGAGMGASAAVMGEDVVGKTLEGAAIGGAFSGLGAGIKAGAALATPALGTSLMEAEAAAAKLAQERMASELAKKVRVKYRDLLGGGMNHEGIVGQLAADPELAGVTPEGIVKAMGAVPTAARSAVKPPKTLTADTGFQFKREHRGMYNWAAEHWPMAQRAGLTETDFVKASAERGIPAEVSMAAMKIPQSEWSMIGAGYIANHKAIDSIVATGGIELSISPMVEWMPAVRTGVPGPRLVGLVQHLKRSPNIPTVGIVDPAETLKAANIVNNASFLLPQGIAAKARALYQTSGAADVFEQASMLMHRALAPARATLHRLGPAGAQLARMLDETFLAARDRGGKDVAKIQAILQPFKLEDRIHIGEIMEGIAIPKSPQHDQAADLLAAVYHDYKVDLSELGFRQLLNDGTVRKFKGRDLYLTRYYDEKIVKKYLTEGTPEFEKSMAYIKERVPQFAGDRKEAKMMIRRWIDTPYEYRTGPINYSRTDLFKDVPYEKDPLKSMSRYVYSVSKRVELAKRFGAKDQGVVELYEQMKKDGHDWKVARNIYDAFAESLPRDYADLTRFTSTFNTVTMLGFTSGLVQPAQLLNVASSTSYNAMLKAIGVVMKDPRASKQWVTSTGAHLNEVIDDLIGADIHSDLGKFWVTNIIGLEPMDKANRIIAAVAGRLHAEELAAKYVAKPTARLGEKLAKLGIDPEYVTAQKGILTPDQLRGAGLRVSLDTQFASGVLDLPEFKNTVGGKFAYQFKSFALQQSNYIAKELLSPAKQFLLSGGKRGDLAPLMRYAAGIGPTGYIIGSLIRSIKGRPEPEDPRLKMIENAALAGGFGIWYDTWKSLERGPNDFIGFFAGPTAGNVAQLTTGAAHAVTGDPSRLAESAVRRIPLIGQTLANYWLYPAK